MYVVLLPLIIKIKSTSNNYGDGICFLLRLASLGKKLMILLIYLIL